MLQKIRERISGWIAGVVIALVAGAFMLFGVEYYFEQGSGNQNSVAKVNGVTITDNQVNDAFSQIQKQTMAEMHGQPLTNAMTQEMKFYALQSLITQTALFTTLQSEHFDIGLTQVKAMVEQSPQFQVQGKFSEEKLMETLYQIGLSPSQFFQRLQSQWIVNQATQGISVSAFALQNEINQLYALTNQQRSFGYVIISAQSFLSKINVTPEQIKNDYTENQVQYQTPAQVSVSYIELSPTDLEKTVTITDADAQQYYQTHLINYQVPERWQVSQITIPIAANASETVIKAAQIKAAAIMPAFEENKNTDYTSSIVMLSATEIDPSLHHTLMSLKINKVSMPLRSANGYTLLKLLKVIPAQTHPFDSVKSNIMQLLQHQKVNDMLTKKSSELSDVTYTNPDSLIPASKKLNLPIQTSPLMTKTGEKKGIFSNPKVLTAIFSDSVFTAGNNSSVIDLADGTQIVLRINKKIPSAPIPLTAVSDQIKQKLAEKQAIAEAGLLAYQLQKKLSSGANSEVVSKQDGLQWHSVSLMSIKEKSTVPQNIIVAAFKTVGVKAVLLDQNNYVVVMVNQVKNANPTAATAAEKEQLSQQLTSMWGQLLQQTFVQSVLKSSHIVMSKKE